MQHRHTVAQRTQLCTSAIDGVSYSRRVKCSGPCRAGGEGCERCGAQASWCGVQMGACGTSPPGVSVPLCPPSAPSAYLTHAQGESAFSLPLFHSFLLPFGLVSFRSLLLCLPPHRCSPCATYGSAASPSLPSPSLPVGCTGVAPDCATERKHVNQYVESSGIIQGLGFRFRQAGRISAVDLGHHCALRLITEIISQSVGCDQGPNDPTQ